MGLEQTLTCLFIIFGRICDVSLGTVRTLFVVQSRRTLAAILGFFEVLIWVFVVARVIHGLSDNPLYAFSYALGYSLGNYVGVTVERWIAFGNQMLMVFSRQGDAIASALRERGVRLTEIMGKGREGPVPLLIVVSPRGDTAELVKIIRGLDRDCYYILEDIRAVSKLNSRLYEPTGWRAILKRK